MAKVNSRQLDCELRYLLLSGLRPAKAIAVHLRSANPTFRRRAPRSAMVGERANYEPDNAPGLRYRTHDWGNVFAVGLLR